MTGGYLDLLDALLADGAQQFSARFIERQVAFVLSHQQPDGGFRGRLGDSDPYYSDFALRLLTLLAPGHAAIRHTARYWTHTAPPPHDIITEFNWLNAIRMLERQGMPLPVPTALAEMETKHTHGAYLTFLSLLSRQMLGRETPVPESVLTAITRLQCADGGFCDTPGGEHGQTNATAAAIAVLSLCNALEQHTMQRSITFLVDMQAPDGGLRAHADAPEGDLLSTYTGLLTLSGLDGIARLQLGNLGRFVQRLGSPTGGFRACPCDDMPDIEYTYYGVGALALLYAYLDSMNA